MDPLWELMKVTAKGCSPEFFHDSSFNRAIGRLSLQPPLEFPRRARRPIVFSEPPEVEKGHCGSCPAALK
jgi:hypothetical protein